MLASLGLLLVLLRRLHLHIQNGYTCFPQFSSIFHKDATTNWQIKILFWRERVCVYIMDPGTMSRKETGTEDK